MDSESLLRQGRRASSSATVAASRASIRNLMYAPDRRIAVVVLSNVNGGAPDMMGDQLFDVVMGKPVVLSSEHKAVPIAKGS